MALESLRKVKVTVSGTALTLLDVCTAHPTLLVNGFHIRLERH